MSEAPKACAQMDCGVSAMCTEDGITAQIMLDGAFSGKIYSHKYSQTHECVYFNSYGEAMILFTIPNYMCGTRLSRDGRNVVNHIENEVYVQFDKDTQNVEDKRYLFICDLSYIPTDFSGTVKPQTIVVQTIEPTRIFVTQTGNGGSVSDVIMSIQDGDGPFQEAVSRPLKLGDVVTLVVRSTQAQSMVYYARLQAFKFPSSDDVYFSCSVDICGSCNFAEVCPSDGRGRRALLERHHQKNGSHSGEGGESNNLEINEIQLHDYIRILDEEDMMSELASQRQAATANDFCFSPVAVAGIMATFGCLSLVLIMLTVFIISIVNRKPKAGGTIGGGEIVSESQYSRSLPSTTASSRRHLHPLDDDTPPTSTKWQSLREIYHAMWNYDANNQSNSRDKSTLRCNTATTSMSRDLR